MIKCFIDGMPVDVDGQQRISIQFDAQQNMRLDKKLQTVEILIPATAANGAVIGDTDKALSRERFNNAVHTARIEVNGCVVIQGEAFMRCVEYDRNGVRTYRIVIREKRPEWIEAAMHAGLEELPIEFSGTADASSIQDSWTWEQPVRFFPITGRGNGKSTTLSAANYHPFLHVKSLVEAIANQTQYRIVSDFMETPLFRSLYMSGKYDPPKVDQALKNACDFRAGCFEDRSAMADSYGRVKADPASALNSIGNIVETAEPHEIKNGKVAEGVFNTDGVFQMIGGRAAFVPSTTIRVGFEFNLAYITPYKIISRTTLSGFDTVFLGSGQAQTFRIANRFRDLRAEFAAATGYRLIVFNHQNGDTYQLCYDRVVNSAADMDNLQPTDVQKITHCTFSARTASITVAAGYRITNPSLWVKASGADNYTPYTGDWALYDPQVTETGTTKVEIVLSSPQETISPSNPKFFDTVWFGGANQTDRITLCKETFIKPAFSAGEDAEQLTFRKLAAHGIRQIDLMKALAQMFDLRFITDQAAREVRMEPYGNLFCTGEPVDWCGRTDLRKPVVIREAGGEGYAVTVLAYRSDPDATRIGEWTHVAANRMAREGTTTLRNPLFVPTLSAEEMFHDAPSAPVMLVGNSQAIRIVSYAGMTGLPGGQVWGWPSYGESYPLAGFHLPGASLCFEDRDRNQGLHRFHDPGFERKDKGREITAYLDLTSCDIQNSAQSGNPTALYTIDVDREPIRCTLEKIADYDPAEGGPAECTFLII